ncbi:MAG: hypothetical protein ACFE8O_06445 [Candidatus Hermodarchaeota archaeon]
MTKPQLPADKQRKMVTRAEDTTNSAYGRVPETRTITELFQNGVINLDSLF